MSNKLIKEQEKESVLHKLVNHLLSPVKGSAKGIPHWYWYLFLIVVVYSLCNIKI